MFIEIAEAHPRFLRKQLLEVVGAMLQVGSMAERLSPLRVVTTTPLAAADGQRGRRGTLVKLPRRAPSVASVAAVVTLSLCALWLPTSLWLPPTDCLQTLACSAACRLPRQILWMRACARWRQSFWSRCVRRARRRRA